MRAARLLTVSQHALRGGGGVPTQGGLPGEVSAQGCVVDPPVDRMTDRCKNITLPQLCCGR